MQPWLNTDAYSWLELALTLTGSVLWVAVYVQIIRNVHRNRFMEMPLIAVAGNVAWEGLYSFYFNNYINLGDLLLWGYRAWFILDIYIVILTLRYGYRQFDLEFLRRHIKPFFFTLFALYFVLIWSCVVSGVDNLPLGGDGTVRLGGISAYVLNIVISTGYLYTYLRHRSAGVFTVSTAWMKCLGTLCFSVFFALVDPGNILLITMAAIVFALDITYLAVQWKYPQPATPRRISAKPILPVNLAFERLWEQHPESQSYYERCGLRLRQLTFDRWNYTGEGSFQSKYWVLEGNIVRQTAQGQSTALDILTTTNVLRSIAAEVELEWKHAYLFTDARESAGGDLETRKYTVDLFSDPKFEHLNMYLIAGRLVRAAMQITFPINPDVMNKWKMFADEDAAFAALMLQFTDRKPRKNIETNLSDNVVTVRLKQVYDALANIADTNTDPLHGVSLPEDDQFREVFDALHLVKNDKIRQVGMLQSVNELLAAKNVQVEAERERSELLLLNILPVSIAERLKNGERLIADHYPNISILFADIVNFTPMSMRYKPQQLISMLNSLYTRFDRLTEIYGVERIKTIGDAYMAVAGAPLACGDHAERIANFAVAMMNEAAAFTREWEESIVLRVGINSGEAIGAVVGEKKFAYDLWGDAVNTAARMESHGEPGKIHCSEAFARQLGTTIEELEVEEGASSIISRSQFIISYRGEMDVKGKGKMRTYFLETMSIR